MAVYCPFVQSSFPTAGRESCLIMLPVSASETIQACHREVCWLLFCSYYIPAKCLSWWRIDYVPMQMMTPQYWQLFASQQADLLLLPSLTETWLGFRSGEITDAYSHAVHENRLHAYADDSILLAVVLKPADRPAAAAASFNRDLASIQEW